MITHWHKAAPEAPFYAVIFISQKSEDLENYTETDAEMMRESHKVEGFLGYSSKGDEKTGIFISYWRDQDAIEKWRQHQGHLKAKNQGAKRWYNYYHSIICKVEQSVEFGKWLEMQGG